jgi:hypothetical protein
MFAGVAGLLACTNPSTTSTTTTNPKPPTATRADPAAVVPGSVGTELILDVQPWAFGEQAGQVIRTRHYAIHTTERSPAIAERLPGFMEAALGHYRSVLTTLPAPTPVLETFVMADRKQWQAMVRQVLGPLGEPATRIRRGGLTYRGRAMLFDIGAGDTLSIASHEGWHQYTQTTFRQPMPVWLEEGMATYVEGHRWVGRTVVFGPWANVARYDRLKQAFAQKQLRPLEELLTNTPGSMLGMDWPGKLTPEMLNKPVPSQDAPVIWYAQVWALMHFLAEGEGGKYRSAVIQALTDASTGNLRQGTAIKLGLDTDRQAIGLPGGLLVFRAYFGEDLAGLDAEYQRFIAELSANGVRTAIVAGRSPLATAKPDKSNRTGE